MLDVSKLRPTKLENCIIQSSSLHNLMSCDFNNMNVLLRGKAGVGKTLISSIIKQTNPLININENITTFNLTSPSISTTTNLRLYSSVFDKIIDIIPVSKLNLLKALCHLIEIPSPTVSLYTSIELYYPNINKILNHYLNEN